jgi:DNA repair exonuclease SbcCD ATPase subunit
MVPQRIRLKGFLSYKDEQEICFDGASLWLLAGCNGSGKSTVFDAVTYALFGYHRGGSQEAHELINKDSERAVVEFDFALDGRRYQACRTLQRTRQGRGRGTQQIFRWSDRGTKEPIPDTNQKTGYDAWMQQHLGLNYETFTSSVLLLQGKAEKLLDSTARGRFEVLAGIVDLQRYQQLHQRADEERKRLDSECKGLELRKGVLANVSEDMVAEAQNRCASLQQARQNAQREFEGLQELEFQARQWQDLQNRLTAARLRVSDARQVLGEEAAIERDVQRLQELEDVLPRVQVIVEQRGQIQIREKEAAYLAKEKETLEAQRAEREDALRFTREKQSNLTARIAGAEDRRSALAVRLRHASTLLERLKEHDRQEKELARIRDELARLPADPGALRHAAQEAHDHVAVVAQVVPLLGRLRTQREELRQAHQREIAATKEQKNLQQRGEEIKAQVQLLTVSVEEATKASQAGDESATRTQTLLEQARQQLKELTQLQGAASCRHCGQPLTSTHFQAEKKRRDQLVGEAEAAAAEASKARRAAHQKQQDLRGELKAVEELLQKAREDYRERAHLSEQMRKDVERLQRDCGQSYGELPLPYRLKVSPGEPASWLETRYPEADELDALRQQATALDASRRRLGEAQEINNQWTALKGQEAAAGQSLARLQADLPAQRDNVRQDHVRLENEDSALERELTALRKEAGDLQAQLKMLEQQHQQAFQALTDLQGRLSTAQTSLLLGRQMLERASRDLPPSWQTLTERAGLKDLSCWREEREKLSVAQTEQRGRQLEQARHNLKDLEAEVATLEAEQQRYPAEACQELSQIQAKSAQAREEFGRRDEDLAEALQQLGLLESQRRQRLQVEQLQSQTQRELGYMKRLAEYLGRGRLQLHLVRRAERQVVAYANAVLDRLSAGELCLRLRGEAGTENSSEAALELEVHNRLTGEKPISVAFLSGSQKFRVAVSLALGLGQYASRQHRPIESVIIDEGFGCLDRNGRQVMIQELHNLRDQMRCILLVSHQEEFADAFAHSYRFEVQNGTTVVKRYQP